MTFFSRAFLVLFCFGSMISCSNNPPVLSPTKQLVKERELSFSGELNQNLQAIIQNTASGQMIKFNRQNLALSDIYTSALGLKCREVYLYDEAVSDKLGKRVVCYDHRNNLWQLVREISQQKGKVSLNL